MYCVRICQHPMGHMVGPSISIPTQVQGQENRRGRIDKATDTTGDHSETSFGAVLPPPPADLALGLILLLYSSTQSPSCRLVISLPLRSYISIVLGLSVNLYCYLVVESSLEWCANNLLSETSILEPYSCPQTPTPWISISSASSTNSRRWRRVSPTGSKVATVVSRVVSRSPSSKQSSSSMRDRSSTWNPSPIASPHSRSPSLHAALSRPPAMTTILLSRSRRSISTDLTPSPTRLTATPRHARRRRCSKHPPRPSASSRNSSSTLYLLLLRL
jgi:hypothetical protein